MKELLFYGYNEWKSLLNGGAPCIRNGNLTQKITHAINIEAVSIAWMNEENKNMYRNLILFQIVLNHAIVKKLLRTWDNLSKKRMYWVCEYFVKTTTNSNCLAVKRKMTTNITCIEANSRGFLYTRNEDSPLEIQNKHMHRLKQ